MIIDLDDKDLEIILKTLAEKHIILHWKNEEENKFKVQKVLQYILELTIDAGKHNIVHTIFETMDKA